MRFIVYTLWSILAIFLAGVVIFFMFFVHYEPVPLSQRILDAERESNVRRQQAQQREYQARETAQKARESAHQAQVTDLNNRIEAKWRADVAAARMTAEPGKVPPMLEVQESASFVTVTNKLENLAVCVSLHRVSRRTARPNDVDRCLVGPDTCRELMPRESFRFQQYSAGNPPACAKAPLEYRVGTPLSPEPSWWSGSALEDFDARPPPEPLRTQSYELWPLRGNVAALNDLLAEKDRALRWRQEFGPRVDTSKVEAD